MQDRALARDFSERTVGVPAPGIFKVLPERILRRDDVALLVRVGDPVNLLVAG